LDKKQKSARFHEQLWLSPSGAKLKITRFYFSSFGPKLPLINLLLGAQ
jgi:hypothetical protein